MGLELIRVWTLSALNCMLFEVYVYMPEKSIPTIANKSILTEYVSRPQVLLIISLIFVSTGVTGMKECGNKLVGMNHLKKSKTVLV